MGLTLVSVPVLSEQMTETAPSVSTVARDLQRILFFFMMLAPMVRLMATATGRPSGTKAIPTLTQFTMSKEIFIQLGWAFRSQAALSSINIKWQDKIMVAAEGLTIEQ